MEATRAGGPTIEQKHLMYQLFLTLLVAGIVSTVLHKPILMFSLVSMSWLLSVFSLGRDGYLVITRMVLAMGVMMYLIARFFFPAVGVPL